MSKVQIEIEVNTKNGQVAVKGLTGEVQQLSKASSEAVAVTASGFQKTESVAITAFGGATRQINEYHRAMAVASRQAGSVLPAAVEESSKAVRTNTADTAALQKTLDRMTKGLSVVENFYNAGMIDPQREASESAKILERALREMLAQGVDPSSAVFQKYQRQLGALKQAQVEMTGEMRSSNPAIQQQTSAFMSMNNIIQQAPFGFRSVAHTLPALIDRFQRLISTSGGVKKALGGLVGSLMGPAGIVFAISAGVAAVTSFGPKIVDWFREAGVKAEKMREQVAGAMASIVSLKEEFDSFVVAGEGAKEIVSDLDKEIEQIKGSNKGLEQSLVSLTAAQDRSASGQAARIRGEITANRERISGLEDERETFQELADEYDAMSRAQDRARRLGLERKDDGKAASKEAEEAAKKAAQAAKERREAEAAAQAARIAVMQEGTAKVLAQIDFQVDQEIAKARESYAEKYPALFAEIESLLEEQREQLRAKLLTKPLLEVAGDPNALLQPLEEALLDLGDPLQVLDGSLNGVNEELSRLQALFNAATTDEARADLALMIAELEKVRGKLEEIKNTSRVTFEDIAGAVREAAQVLGGVFNAQHVSRMNEIAAERSAALDSIDRQLASERLSQKQKTDLLQERAKLEKKFEDQRKRAARKQAENAKLVALFEIAINTAAAVVKALPNLVLAGIVGVLGLAQGAVVAATPVPSFRKGVRDFKGGLAQVHKDEIVYLPRGASVASQSDSRRVLDTIDRMARTGSSFDDRRMVEAIGRQGRALEAMARKMGRMEVSLNIRELDENYARFVGEDARVR